MKTIKPEQMMDDYIIIDVRSPLEYEDHHIPGSISIPLLENAERHEVGFLYKQVSVEKAYKKGLEFITGKMDKLIAKLLPYKNRKLLVCCARGGMRSYSVTRLLESLNFNATQLEGGMKTYRNYVLKQIETFDYPELIVIQGYTGSAKTKYIEHLENSIDLEKCANHQSSLFGAVGLRPNSQKMFLFLLYENLKKAKKYKKSFIEGEARKVGDAHIPESLWKKMGKSKIIFLEVSLKNRAKHILERYPDCGKHEQEYITIIRKLKQSLSTELTEELVEKFKAKEYLFVIEQLLEKYYDPKYKHFMKDMKIAETIDGNEFEKTLKKLKSC